MKVMKCSQLGGPEDCDVEFEAETFEKMAKQSQEHGMEMSQQDDEAHLIVMEEMKLMMQDPDQMQQWMDNKRSEFDELGEE